MEIIPLKTRALLPPQDSLVTALAESELTLQDGDVVAISSKVVAIDEGRCLELSKEEKTARIKAEAAAVIERPYWSSPLTIIHNCFISGAGFDQSNGNGYTILLPEDPFASAERLHGHLCTTYGVTELGVIITDSRSLPLRYGASGVAIGWWGMSPLTDHRGSTDIFGRKLQFERSNLVDGLAAAATVVMGETNEQVPVAILRQVPNLTFTAELTKDQLFCPPEQDTFRILYQHLLAKD